MTHDTHFAKTAAVRNLFDSRLAGDTKQRMMELHPHSQRLWGIMTVAQTLAHCTSGLGLRYFEKRYSPVKSSQPVFADLRLQNLWDGVETMAALLDMK